MRRTLAALATAAALLAPSAPASAHPVRPVERPLGEPCADVAISYFPTEVQPGRFLSFSEDLSNCSTMAEDLVVVTRTVGPCGYDVREVRRESLPAMGGVGFTADGRAPSCLGTWRTAVVVRLAGTGQILANDIAGFRVVGSTR